MALRYLHRTIVYISLVILLITIIGMTWLFKLGFRLDSVQTGSMEPLIRPGDALVVRSRSMQQLQPGQIITYRSAAHPNMLISHRLQRKGRNGDLITKGDHLKIEDPPVQPWQLTGRAYAIAPGLGRWLQRLRSPLGLCIGIYLPALAIMGTQLIAIASLQTSVYRLRPLVR